MPNSPLKPCLSPGCPELVEHGRCQQHSKQKERYRNQQRGPRIYDTQMWKRLRKVVLARDILCKHKGCHQIANEVDHIVPLPEGSNELENLQGLCKAHHSQKTRTELRGRG